MPDPLRRVRPLDRCPPGAGGTAGHPRRCRPWTLTLVLEGGGVKGIALVGAYTALSEAGYDVHRIAGTSAGAIVGALIASGMTRGDLRRVMREIDYGRFENRGFLDHLGLVGKGAPLLFEKGIYEGSYLRAFMNDQLATDFDIDETRQDTLFKSGRQAAEAFLEVWDFETYVKTYRSGAILDVPELVDGTT